LAPIKRAGSAKGPGKGAAEGQLQKKPRGEFKQAICLGRCGDEIMGHDKKYRAQPTQCKDSFLQAGDRVAISRCTRGIAPPC